ncbi:MAG: Putative integral membrane protein (DedA homolog) [uncultured Sulfurovum sp.]|uniref:Integral membrane protein (DedA homolog) n=1 Tax=uncultured Sulfurovum sp. TaxID=269237 RepID=A0A6S6SF49_9BACT|nr:MAG: Putative integral membrane protein (DedA homolog) [uncultured Sulfurovum sp.]
MGEIVEFVVGLVEDMGYWGIFVMMFLESTFFPFPSEVAMIPAGILVAQGKMNLTVAILVGTAGSLFGALFNYFLARKYGRKGVLRFGKYFFFTEEKLQKMEKFFVEHGSFSTFVARLIPGVRQLVSLPAGLSKMHLGKFSLHTSLGAGIWVTVLVLLGYFIGGNEALIKEYLHQIIIGTLVLIFLASLIYVYLNKRRQRAI